MCAEEIYQKGNDREFELFELSLAYIYKPDCLLVVHEGLLEFSLLLKDTRQVGVSCCKLWEDLIKTNRKIRVKQ